MKFGLCVSLYAWISWAFAALQSCWVVIGTFDEFMAVPVDVLTMTTNSTQSMFFSTSAQARAKLH
jgi:hypothetical protein